MSHIRLTNETKIAIGNIFAALRLHNRKCATCWTYTTVGDGDLCPTGKDIIGRELAYAATTPIFEKGPQ